MLRSVALYLVLVGTPLAGLFVILQWGEALEPPPSVGGDWTVREACSAVPAGTVLTIQQSGRFLRAKLRDGVAQSGRLEGSHLQARMPANVGQCEGQELVLDVELGADGESLVGTIGAPTCSACPTSPLTAERENEKE